MVLPPNLFLSVEHNPVILSSAEDEPSYCDVASEEEEHDEYSSPVYDQVPERDEYIDSKHLRTAQRDAQLLNQQV